MGRTTLDWACLVMRTSCPLNSNLMFGPQNWIWEWGGHQTFMCSSSQSGHMEQIFLFFTVACLLNWSIEVRWLILPC